MAIENGDRIVTVDCRKNAISKSLKCGLCDQPWARAPWRARGQAADSAGFRVPFRTLIQRITALARITSTHTIITTVTTEFR